MYKSQIPHRCAIKIMSFVHVVHVYRLLILSVAPCVLIGLLYSNSYIALFPGSGNEVN